MSTWWPDLDDHASTPEEQRMRRDETLRKLKQKVEAMPELTVQEIEILRWVIDTARGLRWIGKGGRAAFVLLAVIAAAVASWDKLIGGFKTWLQQ